MDQDYERRLLRQIIIQNENTVPCVSEMRRTLTPANSPVSSPSKHGDRFIPSRAGANWSVNFHRINGTLSQMDTCYLLPLPKPYWTQPATLPCPTLLGLL
ncbi:fizzy/cell division cycle 20 related 1 (Drosophila) (predicted), isoform CRA_b [Rattus norvegicus]|uniref:Fizzy/cell division cycle 20 related 1 (Drosophila) (Predicted), isoform CRA_b n=1 Tax=Rattus norvegicus TaxID=10116 RepID=A6K883_RAT|nr:fizzy/cell division cycle 20 related 1 (Drosophila) (predicted), isoform CRA_b [Rattus norvegicus]